MKLTDHSAIVAGGGRGIGRAIALGIAREGADVLVFARTASEVNSVADEIRTLGRRSVAFSGDVGDAVAVAAATSLALKTFGSIDILVNAAGVQGPIGPLWENDLDGWLEITRTHLIGTFLFCREILPSMIARRRGTVINFSGGGAATPRPRFSAYASTKAAVVRLTETLAEELKPYNVRVNAVAPGAVFTRLTEAVIAAGERAGDAGLAEALHTRETGGTPPERAAELVAFLASPDSGNLTGRLISAVWDDWPAMAKQFPELAAVGGYALRRLDPYVFALAFQSEPLRAKLLPAAPKEPE